jgi:serine/threonine protein phosphatase PrpC
VPCDIICLSTESIALTTRVDSSTILYMYVHTYRNLHTCTKMSFGTRVFLIHAKSMKFNPALVLCFDSILAKLLHPSSLSDTCTHVCSQPPQKPSLLPFIQEMANTSSGRDKKRKRREITFQKIFGIIPAWAILGIVGPVTLFVSLNGYLAVSLASEQSNPNELMPVTFLRQMWDKSAKKIFIINNATSSSSSEMHSSNCPSHGCPLTPPEYMDEQVIQAVDAIKRGAPIPGRIPFASWRMASLTRKSNRQDPPFNQDAAVLIQPYITAHTTLSSDFFAGIFDGHGNDGHINAQYFAKDVPKRLAEKLNGHSPGIITSATMIKYLKDAFVESDRLAPLKMTLRGGCTASVTVRIGNTLYFANAGDSTTILVSVNTTEFEIVQEGAAPGVLPLYTTRADKPHLPEEKARILAAGGHVHIPPKNPNLSRVIVDSKEFNDTIGLAMSRSLGDYEWTVIGVTPEPLVDIVHLDDYKNITEDPLTSIFLIVASDGLWDLRLKQWYTKQFAESYLKGHDKRRIHPLVKMHEMIVFVSPKNEAWYRDDISAITVQIV